MTEQKNKSTLIFVGSRHAGLMRQLNRLAQDVERGFEPLITLALCEALHEGEDAWFERATLEQIKEHALYDFLTYYSEGSTRYYVVVQKLWSALKTGRTPLLGMTSAGLERLISHRQAEPLLFSAVLLQPADQGDFQEALMREHGLDSEMAAEETERAVRQSTIPPAASEHPSSIIPVPIYGTADDSSRIDIALRSFVSP